MLALMDIRPKHSIIFVLVIKFSDIFFLQIGLACANSFCEAISNMVMILSVISQLLLQNVWPVVQVCLVTL